jgi:CRISPR-associated protein Cas5t
MLLSLVGEYRRARHAGVGLAFAYARRPKVATTLRKLSRYKYGVSAKQEKLGNAPDYIETLCGIDFLCWVDSTSEASTTSRSAHPSLEVRVLTALHSPADITRTGLVCLGLSDDAIDNIELVAGHSGVWHPLLPREGGPFELPVWVDHVGSADTRWVRFEFQEKARAIDCAPESEHFVRIIDPRPRA